MIYPLNINTKGYMHMNKQHSRSQTMTAQCAIHALTKLRYKGRVDQDFREALFDEESGYDEELISNTGALA